MTESWRSVPSAPGYEASDLGRVRSLDRMVTDQFNGRTRVRPFRGCVLRACDDGRGYLYVKIKKRSARVHSLVLEAFVGPPPEGMEGCHNDGNKRNNHLSNLRWDTPSNNQHDVTLHGHCYLANRTHCKRGHRLVQPNLVQRGFRLHGHRTCLACSRAAWRHRTLRERGVKNVDLQALADRCHEELIANAGQGAVA